ncbi:unnamed protein product [Polarella glacialis]|uniref:ATP synthase F1 complex delta/epsilon subunit N-terminal domain-containing protein n=1 Tax=Polarella glacialis TaxID=89957 RepID=A0A813LD92_POLGL|nr:unnamed protein product [Polarella glacialis]CAE8721678.1 unnamed protein product [Polarella glacialis]
MARSSQVPAAILLLTAGVLLARHVGEVFCSGARPMVRGRSVSSLALQAEAGESGDRVLLKVLSPEGAGISQSCSEVILPSASGQLGVLAGHAPMMSALDIGVLRYKQAGVWKPLVVMGGFASIDSNTLSVLVNDWETADGIEMDQAKSNMDEATRLLEKSDSKKDKLDATQMVKKAAARLQAAMFMTGSKK